VLAGLMGLGMLRILGSQLFFHPDLVQNKLLSRILNTINKIININIPSPQATLHPTHTPHSLIALSIIHMH